MVKMGVAVIGVGTLGRRHAENLRRNAPEAEILAVCDSNLQRAGEVAAELEIAHFCEHIEEILDRQDVRAVVIATPCKFHAEQIVAAARAGKHVFCEKPLALSLAEADGALAAVHRAGVQLQIGFMRRYDPAYAAAQNRIEAGEIGEPVIFKSVGRDRQPPPISFFQGGANGTLFSDAAIHDFDLARWMMRDEIAAVHSFAGILACPELAPFGDVDSTVVNIRFVRGGIGNIEAFRKSNYGYDIRTEILGTKGAVHVGYLSHTPFQVLTQTGIQHDVVDHWLARFSDAYLAELRDFVRSIQKDLPVRVNGEDGLRALRAALGAEESYREGLPVSVASQPRPAGP
jgi:inositol 2-dehydrogenase